MSQFGESARGGFGGGRGGDFSQSNNGGQEGSSRGVRGDSGFVEQPHSSVAGMQRYPLREVSNSNTFLDDVDDEYVEANKPFNYYEDYKEISMEVTRIVDQLFDCQTYDEMDNILNAFWSTMYMDYYYYIRASVLSLVSSSKSKKAKRSKISDHNHDITVSTNLIKYILNSFETQLTKLSEDETFGILNQYVSNKLWFQVFRGVKFQKELLSIQMIYKIMKFDRPYENSYRRRCINWCIKTHGYYIFKATENGGAIAEEEGSSAGRTAESMPASQPSMVFSDDTMPKLINGAEIAVNYDSDSSESSSPSNSAREPLAPLEYKLDRYFNIPNYSVVHEMKDKVAKSISKPNVNHLLNFWLVNLNGCFSNFVIFFQYLQYHVERLNLINALTPMTYRDLVDAVIRREHFFQPIFNNVSNIPIMCQYKFLIFDDNYPDIIYINPDLLELKMIPLAGGLPTAVMYPFNRKRKWLISELRREFPDCDDEEFYSQLCNFLNDRPDLVMLEAPKPRATFPEMSIVLNEHVSLRFCCYMFTLEDLHVAEKLHLREDHIKSMKQFIPQR